jgi:hypothetical protein
MHSKKKIKISGLNMKQYTLKKPIAIKPDGNFVMTPEIMSRPGFARRSLRRISMNLQVRLAVERNRIEPSYKLGIIGKGVMTKRQVIDQIRKRTAFGRRIVAAEMDYCNELMSVLIQNKKYSWPKKTKPRPSSIPEEWRWIPRRWWRKWRQYFRNIVLFCENTTDEITKHAAEYRMKYVHPVFKSKGFIVLALYGADDVRARFAPIASNKRVVYISGVGHGSPSKYTGHMGNALLKASSYDTKEVRSKVIQLLSCQTAQRLGPDLIRKGASAFAGYYENFTFVFDQPGTTIDEMELFWKCDSIWDLMMADAQTVEHAHHATMNAYNAAIASVPNTVAATWLTHDRNCFRSPVTGRRYGSKKAKLSPYIISPGSPFAEVEHRLHEFNTLRI